MGNRTVCFNDSGGAAMTDETPEHALAGPAPDGRQLPAAARRALEEAAARREAYRAFEEGRPREIGGRGGREPVRYGDWEVKGLASDF
jgi:hypothetical protein